MVQSLLELSMKRVAQCMVNGQLEKQDFQISDDKISNKILHHISQDPKCDFSFQIVDEITKKLNVSKLKINQYNENIFYMASRQNLKELIFGRKSKTDDNEKDIVVLLKNMLNDKSLRGLKRLSIEGYPLNKTKMLADILPSITSLSLRHCFGIELRNFYDSFKNLEHLELSSTLTYTLRGISSMKNLEVLILNGNTISSRDDMIDIFELEKLRVLDLGYHSKIYGLGMNLKHFLECEDSLPELRFLDCAQNDMSLKDLEKLVKTHPKLDIIGLLGTPIQKTAQLPNANRNLKLLTIENLENSLDSLNHYARLCSGYTDSLNFIIQGIKNKVILNPETLTDHEFRKCFDSMVSILSRTKSTNLFTDSYIQILKALVFQNTTNLSDQNCHKTIKTVIHVLGFFDLKSDNPTTNYDVQIAGWAILTSAVISKNSSGWTDKLCEVAVKLMEDFDLVETKLFRMVLFYLEKSIRNITWTRGLALVRNHAISLVLHRMLDLTVRGGYLIKSFLNVARTLLEIAHRSPSLVASCHRNYISHTFKMLEKFENNPYVENLILENVDDALEFLAPSAYELCFEGNLKRTILRLLNTERTHEMCVSFLVTLMQLHVDKVVNLPQHSRLVDKILDRTSELVYLGGSDMFRIVRHVRASESEEAREWGVWVARNFNKWDKELNQGEPMIKKVRFQ